MIDWGQKKNKPQAPGIQIGPRVSRGSGLNMPDFGKGISDALNSVGRAARGATQARERAMAPKSTAAAGKRAPARRATKKYR